MANARDPVAKIPNNSSFPFGEDKCIVVDGYTWDGTAVDGNLVKLDTTVNNKIVQCGANEDALGVAVYDPTLGFAKGVAPTAGLPARVCIHGPVSARYTGSTGNIMGGFTLLAAAAGVCSPAADNNNSIGTLLDHEALDPATASEHIIMFRGNMRNDAT
jgi:hypothetical protein